MTKANTIGITIMAAALTLVSACANDDPKLPLIKETTHGRFYSPNTDADSTVSILGEAFEANYDRIATLFEYESDVKTTIHVYTDREQYQAMIGRNTEGTYDASDRIIKVYTPADLSDPVTKHNFNEQIVHEFVHQVIQQISPNVGQVKWLDEGIAYYASKQLEEEMQIKAVYYDMPSFEQFADPDYFGKAGGAAYFYSGTMVKYIAEDYGTDALNEMIRHPDQEHFEEILNVTAERFFEAWHERMNRKE